MLDKAFVKQPQQEEQIQNNIKERMQKIVLGEGQFAQNKQRIHNSLSVSKLEPFSIKLNFIPQRV